MAAPHGFSPDEYARWINLRIGAEVLERREALGLSAYVMGKAGGVSDQTYLNIEQGKYAGGSLTGTLARICARFGVTLSELIAAAERRP